MGPLSPIGRFAALRGEPRVVRRRDDARSAAGRVPRGIARSGDEIAIAEVRP